MDGRSAYQPAVAATAATAGRRVQQRDIELFLPADEHLEAESRRRTLGVLTMWEVDPATSADIVICVDRLVRSAAARGIDRVTLRLTSDAASIRVHVTRWFAGVDHRLSWPLSDLAGGGPTLSEVGPLASRWGATCEADRATVWFEVAVPHPSWTLTDPADGTARAGASDEPFDRPPTRAEISRDRAAPRRSGSGDVLVHGSLRINLITRSAEVDHTDQPVRLTGREFELLMHLIRNDGSVQSRRDLLRAVWGIDFDTDTAVVEVTISRLRRKLNLAELKTIKDMGYVFGELREARAAGEARAPASA